MREVVDRIRHENAVVRMSFPAPDKERPPESGGQGQG
jgi:hypothetical protein